MRDPLERRSHAFDTEAESVNQRGQGSDRAAKLEQYVGNLLAVQLLQSISEDLCCVPFAGHPPRGDQVSKRLVHRGVLSGRGERGFRLSRSPSPPSSPTAR